MSRCIEGFAAACRIRPRSERLCKYLSGGKVALLLMFTCTSPMLSCTYFDNKTVAEADTCSTYIGMANEIIGGRKLFSIRPLILSDYPEVPRFSIQPDIGAEGKIQVEISVTSLDNSLVREECVIKVMLDQGKTATFPIADIHIIDRGYKVKLLVNLENHPAAFASLKRHKVEKIAICLNTSTGYESAVKDEQQDYFQSLLPCLEEPSVRRWFKRNGKHNWRL
jgi:hypothetical protein